MSDSIEPYVPPAEDVLVEGRSIGWPAVLPMMLAILFAPTRVGSRLAVSSWPKAIAGYLIATSITVPALVLGLGATCTAPPSSQAFVLVDPTPPLIMNLTGGETWSETLRLPVATMINESYVNTATPGTAWSLMIPAIGAYLLPWPAALLFMSMNASSLRGCNRYLLSLKLTLWSTSSLAAASVLALGVLGVMAACKATLNPAITQAAMFAVILSWAATWPALVAKLGLHVPRRFFHAPETTLHALCSRCGYILTGLDKASCCPECGLPVHDSLPELRSAPRFAVARVLPEGFVAFWSTLRAAMLDRDFFKRLSLDRGRQGALRFAMWTSVVAGILSAIATGFVHLFGHHTRNGCRRQSDRLRPGLRGHCTGGWNRLLRICAVHGNPGKPFRRSRSTTRSDCDILRVYRAIADLRGRCPHTQCPNRTLDGRTECRSHAPVRHDICRTHSLVGDDCFVLRHWHDRSWRTSRSSCFPRRTLWHGMTGPSSSPFLTTRRHVERRTALIPGVDSGGLRAKSKVAFSSYTVVKTGGCSDRFAIIHSSVSRRFAIRQLRIDMFEPVRNRGRGRTMLYVRAAPAAW